MSLMITNFFLLPSSTKPLLTSCRPSILSFFLLPMAKNTLLFIRIWLRYSCFFFFLDILESMWGVFIPLFLLYNPKFVIQYIFGKLSCQLFLCIFSFENWILDEEVMSFFIYLNLRIHALLFFTFWHFWNTPLALSLQVPSFFDCYDTSTFHITLYSWTY